MCIIIVVITLLIQRCVTEELILKNVLILSRHNLRTPLASDLNITTQKPWPVWNEKPGYLTAKGARLEGLMGEYFNIWLKSNEVLTNDCPEEKDFFAYANVKQRTKKSAKAFVKKAFPNCTVPVHVSPDQNDPIYEPVIHNSSKKFIEQGIRDMADKMHRLNLKEELVDLEKILDYAESYLCRSQQKCDLVNDENRLFLAFNKKPGIKGPLKISKSVIDSFLMENYEGKEVAWGEVSNENMWRELSSIWLSYHDVVLNTSSTADDIARPLVLYMRNIWLNPEDNAKVTFLMGHDANIFTTLSAMKFKSYSLQNQHEKSPLGGKIVFQKWFSPTLDEYLLKIEYVYQSTEQLRNEEILTFENPPQFHTLELQTCKINSSGHCKWSEFVDFLNKF